MVPDLVADLTPPGEGDESDGGQRAAREGLAERPAVLLDRRPVLLDPVDAVEAPLELTERGGGGHEFTDSPEDEGEVLPGRAGALRLLDGLGEELAARPRQAPLDGVHDD